MYTEVQAGKTIRFSHDPTDINFKGKSLWNEWEYKKINMGIKNYSQKEIFGMQPTNYEFLDKIAYDNKMSSIVYDYYPFEVEIRDNNLYFFIITNRSEKKIMFSSSLNTGFDKLCDSLIKCIMTDVKKQIPKKFLKAKGFL